MSQTTSLMSLWVGDNVSMGWCVLSNMDCTSCSVVSFGTSHNMTGHRCDGMGIKDSEAVWC